MRKKRATPSLTDATWQRRCDGPSWPIFSYFYDVYLSSSASEIWKSGNAARCCHKGPARLWARPPARRCPRNSVKQPSNPPPISTPHSPTLYRSPRKKKRRTQGRRGQQRRRRGRWRVNRSRSLTIDYRSHRSRAPWTASTVALGRPASIDWSWRSIFKEPPRRVCVCVPQWERAAAIGRPEGVVADWPPWAGLGPPRCLRPLVSQSSASGRGVETSSPRAPLSPSRPSSDRPLPAPLRRPFVGCRRRQVAPAIS